MIVWNRIRADFLMRSRLGSYHELLETALTATYQVTGIEGFWRMVTGSPAIPPGRHLVLRHDVDTDPGTAREMWRIERQLGVNSSYFFRLSTRDLDLMNAIADAGGEVGYHYEELATIAKANQVHNRDELLGRMPEARSLFAANLDHLRRATGLPMRTAASHGDWVNRLLGAPNWLLLDDRDFRLQVGIDLEAYDDNLLGHLPSRSADAAPPRCWIPQSPALAIERGDAVIYALVHPRHWRTARLVNAHDDLRRLWEAAMFRLPRPRARGSRQA